MDSFCRRMHRASWAVHGRCSNLLHSVSLASAAAGTPLASLRSTLSSRTPLSLILEATQADPIKPGGGHPLREEAHRGVLGLAHRRISSSAACRITIPCLLRLVVSGRRASVGTRPMPQRRQSPCRSTRSSLLRDRRERSAILHPSRIPTNRTTVSASKTSWTRLSSAVETELQEEEDVR